MNNIINMKKQNLNFYIVLIVVLAIVACHPKPKLVQADSSEDYETVENSNNTSDSEHLHDMSEETQHMVKVEEVLNTQKYTYLNVTENGEKFWIAVPRKEVEIGNTYYYQGGLLKRNFESKEYNRVFETIYLVSDIHSQPINTSETHNHETMADHETSTSESGDIKLAEGAIELSELFANPGKYKGSLIKVTGKCVKFNPMIMNRNWAHIQDGSGDNLDLTVTTSENITVGAIVTLEGIIELDKDFGAGYKYEVIMEKATLK